MAQTEQCFRLDTLVGERKHETETERYRAKNNHISNHSRANKSSQGSEIG